MHTVRKISDKLWEVGHYRPPIQGANYHVWQVLFTFSDGRFATAAVSALNGGGSDAAFSEGSWQALQRVIVPNAAPMQPEVQPAK